MSRQHYDRYELFEKDGSFNVVPGIEIPFKGTDKYVQMKRGKDRFDKLSQEYYGSPLYGWLIQLSNPSVSSVEFEIPDNTFIRIPYPLISTLQDYKRGVELYRLYYGQD